MVDENGNFSFGLMVADTLVLRLVVTTNVRTNVAMQYSYKAYTVMIRYVTIGFHFAGMNESYFTRFREMIVQFSTEAAANLILSARKEKSSVDARVQ